MNLQNTIQVYQDNLNKVNKLTKQYNLSLIELTHRLSLCEESLAEVNFHCYDNDRESILCILGDALGRSDWDRKLQYGNESYRWIKTIEGVKFNIFDAEKIPAPSERPVATTDFPIQLAETSVA